jgi:hypothetical protein
MNNFRTEYNAELHLEYQTTDTRNPIILAIIYHHQKHSEMNCDYLHCSLIEHHVTERNISTSSMLIFLDMKKM